MLWKYQKEANLYLLFVVVVVAVVVVVEVVVSVASHSGLPLTHSGQTVSSKEEQVSNIKH